MPAEIVASQPPSREPAGSDRLPVHRSESPTGYSSAGCSPAEPASASPVSDIVAQSRSGALAVTAAPDGAGARHSGRPWRTPRPACRTVPKPRGPARSANRQSVRPRARRRSGNHAGRRCGRCRAARIGSAVSDGADDTTKRRMPDRCLGFAVPMMPQVPACAGRPGLGRGQEVGSSTSSSRRSPRSSRRPMLSSRMCTPAKSSFTPAKSRSTELSRVITSSNF